MTFIHLPDPFLTLAQSVPISTQARALTDGLVSALAFGIAGLALILLGFKAFDIITPRIDVQRELTENKNMAVAVVVAAIIIGVSIVVSKAISG